MSIILVLLLCLAFIPFPALKTAEAGQITAVPGSGTYDRYQDVRLYNETAGETGITYYVYQRGTAPPPGSTYNHPNPIRIAEDAVLSVDSNVGGNITHMDFSYTINPYILSTYPADGAANVPLNPTINIEFGRKMNEASLENESNITISKIDPLPGSTINSGDYTATYTEVGGKYTLQIQLNGGVTLDSGSTYMVTLNNITDSNGKPLQGTTSFNFTTVAGGDSTTYGYVTTNKSSYGPDQDLTINVTYFQGGAEVSGAVDLQVQVFNPKGVRKSTIAINSLTNGRASVTDTTVLDTANNPAPGTWTVRFYDGNNPRQLLDTCTFTVVESAVTEPTANLEGGRYYEPISVSLSTPTSGAEIYYTIDYDESVIPDPVIATVDESCTKYKGPIVISAPGFTRLRAVAVKGGVISSMLDETYEIRAELGYLNLTPGDDEENVPVLTSVSVTFGRAVKSQSVNAQTFRLRDMDSNTPVTGTVSYNADKRTATFKPADLLKPNTNYEATLDGYTGAGDTTYIEDLNGVGLINNVIWNFKTGSEWITVDGRSVVNNQVSVNKNPAPVVVTYPGATTVILNKVQMAPLGSDQFTGDVALKAGNNNVTIEITDAAGTTTTLKITINYLNILQEGASVTTSIPAKGKLDLFNKQLSMVFPQGTYLRDPGDDTGLPLADQSIVFNVFRIGSADGFPPVSLMYDIQPNVSGAVLNNMGEGTITLAYDKYVSATSGSTLTVLCDPDGDDIWEENLGGKVDTKKRTITVPFSYFGRYVVVNRVWSFTDYSTAGWARAYVEYLWSKGYMKPLPTAGTGQFGLVDSQGQEIPITRGEFAVLLAKVLGMNKANYIKYDIFSDMRLFDSANPPYAMAKDLDGYWKNIDDDDYMYIDMLARNGIIQGSLDDYGNLVFNYFNIISREEVAVILARAMNLTVEADDAKVSAAITKMYTDANTSIAAWAQPYVLAVSKGYFGGYPDKTFRGKDSFTRPQAAAIVYKAMKKNKLM